MSTERNQPGEPPRFVHLLYVPTDACSLRCRYCYLGFPDACAASGANPSPTAAASAPSPTAPIGSQPVARPPRGGSNPVADPATPAGTDPLDTLAFAVEKLRAANVVPFTISLHGGEVTCLPPDRFEGLVRYIDGYYLDNAELIRDNGFKVGRPHIKTNLYGIDRHLEAIARYGVSVSGSLDVPFSLHDAYRTTADGSPTLARILDNVELLRDLPVRKKASATIFREHVDRIDEMIDDLRFLHESTCLDMNDFNFMIGFSDPAIAQTASPAASPCRVAAGATDDGSRNALEARLGARSAASRVRRSVSLAPLSHEEQVAFYRRMHDEFDGTDLDRGVRGPWFAEFTPDYCTGCMNCGEKFFLLDFRGDVYSCVRGQGREAFFYGNVYRDSVGQILATARTKIFLAHNRSPLADECISCAYLRFCMTGCPFVKTLCNTATSYTCKLQQAIYRDHPDLYPPTPTIAADAYHYAKKMRPLQAQALRPAPTHALPRTVPALASIIEADPDLRAVFDATAFSIEVDGERYPMLPQVLRPSRTVVSLARTSRVRVYVRKDILDAACRWPVNNSLYLMLLSGELVAYGDEGRMKQEHVATHQVFARTLAAMPSDDDACYCFDASGLLGVYYDHLSAERPNNLFATTSALRDAHYAKHKANAYYHIQTINLPFPNIELTCDDELPLCGSAEPGVGSAGESGATEPGVGSAGESGATERGGGSAGESGAAERGGGSAGESGEEEPGGGSAGESGATGRDERSSGARWDAGARRDAGDAQRRER